MVLFCDFIINQMQDKILLEKEQSKRRYRSKIRIGLIVANIALGFFYFGYCLVYFGSIPITTILKAYHAAIDQGVAQGILNGCIPVGGFLGSMASSYIIARLSRRYPSPHPGSAYYSSTLQLLSPVHSYISPTSIPSSSLGSPRDFV